MSVTPIIPYPIYRRKPTVKISVIFDTSGSIDANLLGMFVDTLNDVMRTVEPAEVWLFHCDFQVTFVKHYEYPETKLLESPRGIPRPRGGRTTAFTPPFRYMAEHNIKVKNILYFTDLYPTQETPADIEAALPRLVSQIGARKVLWLVPSHIKALGGYWKPNVGRIIWIEPLV